VSERIKQNKYKLTFAKPFFWRTTQQQEIDYVEQQGQSPFAFEFKWNARRKVKIPRTFLDHYDAEAKVSITPYFDLLKC
jgi:hypothetical protein